MPNFKLSQFDPRLKDLFAPDGDNLLCWPTSLAHRMMAFGVAPLKDDGISTVRKLVRLCRTSVTGGTSQKRKLPCIREFLRQAGYKAEAFSIGPSGQQKRAVTVRDLSEHLSKGYGVILHVGWLKLDSARGAWVERGSHSVNAYGYTKLGEDRLRVRVVNPSSDYSGRSKDALFDEVVVSRLDRLPGIGYPKLVDLVLTGPGFDSSGRLAVVEDVFVFRPLK